MSSILAQVHASVTAFRRTKPAVRRLVRSSYREGRTV
jgi:hypothetical protein